MTNPASKQACGSAFVACLEEERQGLQAFVRKLCVSGEDPDNVVQETLGRAWRYRSMHRDGHTGEEHSSRYAMPLNTIKSHIHRARLRTLRTLGRETESAVLYRA